MSTKENLLIVRHVVETFFGKGNLASYEDYIAKDVQVHCPASWQAIHSSEINNLQNTKVIDQEYCEAFFFNEMNVLDIISQQDKICVRWGGEGLHKGKFFSIPATQKSFSLSGQTIYRLNKGRIEEVWQSWDMLGLFHNLGARFKYPPMINEEYFELIRRAEKLSSRERECLKHFLNGKTSKETAASLFLSHRTVEYYFENIKDKLDCSCKRQLYSLARILETHNLL